MPEIKIRPAVNSDIPILVNLDHTFTSDHAWQMELQNDPGESTIDSIIISFRKVRLPRPVQVEYPRQPASLAADWGKLSALMVAVLGDRPIGYAALALQQAPLNAWMTDLVVDRPHRQQGIGTALLLAALEWATNIKSQNLILEMQPRNYPAIRLALKLGFDFCGYNDRYYADHEIGIFFGRPLRGDLA